MRVSATQPTWEERARLRAWYSGVWASIGLSYVWSVGTSESAPVGWMLGLSFTAMLCAWFLGYKRRIMDPVSWAMCNVAFTAR